MSEESTRVIKPSLHHVNIKTTRLQEMIDWYIAVVGAKVNFRFPGGAFLSNDRANHRIAFLTVPGLHEHPEKIAHTGLHHTAFEYENFDDLMSSYARLKQRGIEPQVCLDHGLTTSLYYADPDQNLVELQVDNFSSWDLSSEWMRTSEDFRRDPIGSFFDPDLVLEAYRAGAPFAQLHEDTRAGKYPSSKPPRLNLPPMA
jgi:catechol 2,3-dioxygenase